MVRSPCSDEKGLKKGPWTPEEDKKLKEYIQEHGMRSWRLLPALAGLNRCGKSCRLRWTNYLRPDIKRGNFTEEEEETIIRLHEQLGSKWSIIATHLPGRTDNEIKNQWNTHLKKKLIQRGIDPETHRPRPDLTLMASLPNLLTLMAPNHGVQTPNLDVASTLQKASQLVRLQLVQTILDLLPLDPPQLDPNATIQPLLDSNLLGSQLNYPNNPQLHGVAAPDVDVPIPMHVNPDLGMDPSASSSFVDCTNFLHEDVNNLNNGFGGSMVFQQQDTPAAAAAAANNNNNVANYTVETSPSTSSANSNTGYDQNYGWNPDFSDLLEGYMGYSNMRIGSD